MKFLFLAFVLLVPGYAFSNEFSFEKLEKGDYAVPVVHSRASLPVQHVGTVVYDTGDKAFYGFDDSGSWVQLSAPANIFQQSKSPLINYTIPANQFGDLTSISLTPGEWDITGIIYYYSSAAVTTETIQIGISPNPGNSTVGLEPANNQLSSLKTQAADRADTFTISNYRVIVPDGSNVNYYLKGYAGTSTVNLKVAYRMSARKIQ